MSLFDHCYLSVRNVDLAYSLTYRHHRPEFREYLEPMVVEWDKALFEASSHGDVKAVGELFKKGARNCTFGLHGAANGGHYPLFKCFLDKVDLGSLSSDVMYYAAIGGCMKIIEEIESLLPEDSEKKVMFGRRGMRGACKTNNRDLIEYFGVYPSVSYKQALIGAVEGNQRELVDLFIKKGAETETELLEPASEMGDGYLIRKLIKKGALDFDRGLIGAVNTGNLSLIDFFCELGARTDLAMDYAIRNKDIDVVDYLLDKGFRIGKQSIYWAKKTQDLEMMKFVKDHYRSGTILER